MKKKQGLSSPITIPTIILKPILIMSICFSIFRYFPMPDNKNTKYFFKTSWI